MEIGAAREGRVLRTAGLLSSLRRKGVVALLAGASLLTACGQPAPSATAPPAEPNTATTSSSPAAEEHVLELEVTGTATLSSLTFTLDGKVSEEKAVKPPWRKTVEVPYGTGRHEWRLTMRHSGGSLSATATVDGKLVTRTGGAGSPGSNNTANLTGSFTD
ncbi:hypothetical protein [Amycolatopsis marina]|uniref:hypothetical protein n=1 Tax=Amycolatopsis marina TaxID=490629 RepID=UPI000AAA19E0|nr:hypothetical protein [Amycolatopsis marina]